MPNGERDAVQKRLRLLPQRRLLLKVIVRGVLARVAAATAIRSQPGARQRAAIRVCHRFLYSEALSNSPSIAAAFTNYDSESLLNDSGKEILFEARVVLCLRGCAREEEIVHLILGEKTKDFVGEDEFRMSS